MIQLQNACSYMFILLSCLRLILRQFLGRKSDVLLRPASLRGRHTSPNRTKVKLVKAASGWMPVHKKHRQSGRSLCKSYCTVCIRFKTLQTLFFFYSHFTQRHENTTCTLQVLTNHKPVMHPMRLVSWTNKTS